MRLLAIGFALPNPEIENYNPLTAPSYFDYDVLFVDPAGVTSSVAQLLDAEREFEAHDGRAVVNGPSTASTVSAAEQLRRRADETQRFLEAGRSIIVVARPNATQAGVIGFEGCDRYSWLPAPAGMAWGPPFMRPAEGTTIRISDETHPFSRFLRDLRGRLRYRAVFDDRQAAVRQSARVFGAGGTGVPIAAEFEVLGGRVIFIPSLPDETGTFRTDWADRVVDAARSLTNESRRTETVSWARAMPLPGLEQVEAELEEATQAAAEAEERLTVVRERHDALAAHRRLVTANGPELQEAVAAALQELGFVRTSPAGEALAVESESETCFVETEGSNEAVVEWPYVRLQRRLESALLNDGKQRKGLVVANGVRNKEPSERGAQVTDQLRIACENYRYCLLTGETLFGLLQRALGGAEEGALIGMRRRILAGSGLLEPAGALGEAPEEQDAGPIF